MRRQLWTHTTELLNAMRVYLRNYHLTQLKVSIFAVMWWSCCFVCLVSLLTSNYSLGFWSCCKSSFMFDVKKYVIHVYACMCRGVLFVSCRVIVLKPLHFLLSTKGFIFSLFPGDNIWPLSWQELVFLHQLLCACCSALYLGLTLVSGRILLSCWTMAGTADSNAVTCYSSCLYLHGNTPDTKIICDGNFLLALLWSVACKIDDQSTKISRCDVK